MTISSYQAKQVSEVHRFYKYQLAVATYKETKGTKKAIKNITHLFAMCQGADWEVKST